MHNYGILYWNWECQYTCICFRVSKIKQAAHDSRICDPWLRDYTWDFCIRVVLDQYWTALTHWSRVTDICVSKLTIIGSYNGLLPGRHQAIIWTNAGILLIGPLGTNFSETLIEKFMQCHSRKCTWKCRLENGSHFVSASMCVKADTCYIAMDILNWKCKMVTTWGGGIIGCHTDNIHIVCNGEIVISITFGQINLSKCSWPIIHASVG